MFRIRKSASLIAMATLRLVNVTLVGQPINKDHRYRLIKNLTGAWSVTEMSIDNKA